MKRLTAIGFVLALAACSPPPQKKAEAPAAASPAPAKPVAADIPAGTYRLDKAHASLNFRVNHMGMSHFTARFTRFDVTLQLDPAHPELSKVSAEIDPASLQTNYPEPDKLDFDSQIEGDEFLDAPKFPKMTFVSTKVEPTAPKTAKVTGDLTFHGVTKPVVLDVTYNDGYGKTAFDPSGSRVGFSARASLNRSEFGVGFGVPPPGSAFGVSDAVEIIIEAELTRPLDKP